MKNRTKQRYGFTILELSIAIIILSILVTTAIPIYHKATEQARLDAASRDLLTIWTAQRVYWLENKTYAADLATLQATDLVSSKVANSKTNSNIDYTYEIDSFSDSTFSASAARKGSTRWSGDIFIDQTGLISGSVSNKGGDVLFPISDQ